MTRLEKLISIFGSQEKLAAAVGMSRSHVGHMVQPRHRHYREVLEAKYNERLMTYAHANFDDTKCMEIEDLIEVVCSHCGRAY